eukprot:2098303-Alexandrium_andersonii.AAC.1
MRPAFERFHSVSFGIGSPAFPVPLSLAPLRCSSVARLCRASPCSERSNAQSMPCFAGRRAASAPGRH